MKQCTGKEWQTTQSGADATQPTAALETLQHVCKEVGKPARLIADTGYFSINDVKAREAQSIEVLIAVKREAHHPQLLVRFTEPPPLSEDPTPVERMRHRLATAEGRQWYSRKKCTVEPVFGIMKSVMGFRHLTLHGAKHAKDEWNLVRIAWNLKQIHEMAA